VGFKLILLSDNEASLVDSEERLPRPRDENKWDVGRAAMAVV